MEKLSRKDYLNLKSRDEKKEYLVRITGSEACRMVGRVKKIEEKYCRVRDIKIIDGEKKLEVFEPFEKCFDEPEISASGTISTELKKKNINENDYICYEVEPNTEKYEEQGSYFTIRKNSVQKAEEIYKNIGIKPNDSALFSGFILNQKEHEILFTEDLKKAHKNMLEKINGLDGEISKKKDAFDDLKKMYDEEIKEQNKEEKKLKDRFKDLENEYKKAHEDKKNELLKEQQNLESKCLKSKRELEKYNILLFEEQEIIKQGNKICFDDLDEKIKQIQGYLLISCEKELYYDEKIIKSLYLGLRTEQMIILAGKPGTGKTSLIEGYADAIDAELCLVPVQPNWIDKSDLLGFYNPVEKNFVATPFLDGIVDFVKKADANKDKMFFICLDEMNLAHVEYYFAEFLSKLQTDRKIQLYSKAISEEIKFELKDRMHKFRSDIKDLGIEEFLQNSEDGNIDNYLKVKKLYNMIIKYPAEIEIPHNVKFLGTVNKDETTKDLSPKVIDRSYFIKLENTVNTDKTEKQKTEFEQDKERYSKKLDLINIEANVSDNNVNEEKLKRDIEKIKNLFRKVQISISNRFDKTIRKMNATGECKRSEELLDIGIASLILPKVNHAKEDANYEELIKTLEDICAKQHISQSVLGLMKDDELGIITYWR